MLWEIGRLPQNTQSNWQDKVKGSFFYSILYMLYYKIFQQMPPFTLRESMEHTDYENEDRVILTHLIRASKLSKSFRICTEQGLRQIGLPLAVHPTTNPPAFASSKEVGQRARFITPRIVYTQKLIYTESKRHRNYLKSQSKNTEDLK